MKPYKCALMNYQKNQKVKDVAKLPESEQFIKAENLSQYIITGQTRPDTTSKTGYNYSTPPDQSPMPSVKLTNSPISRYSRYKSPTGQVIGLFLAVKWFVYS